MKRSFTDSDVDTKFMISLSNNEMEIEAIELKMYSLHFFYFIIEADDEACWRSHFKKK